MTEAEKFTMQQGVDRHKGGKNFGRKQAPLPTPPHVPNPEPARFHTDHGFVSSDDIFYGLLIALVIAGVVAIGLFLRYA